MDDSVEAIEAMGGMFRRPTELFLRGEEVTDAVLVHLEGMTGLELLHLEGSKVTGSGLKVLDGMERLRHLVLSRSLITDAGLANLKGLKWLKRLDLLSTQISCAGLEQLAGLTGLQELYLSGTEITDAGLEHLARLTELKVLQIGANKITDAGLAHLKGLTGLRRLSLGSNKITDAGLKYLEGMKRLERLGVDSTMVTDAGLERLEGLTELEAPYLSDLKIPAAFLRKVHQELPPYSPLPDPEPANLTSAETLWKQGDHDGAWRAIDELNAIDRRLPQTIDLRLRILTCLCKWGRGDELAGMLRIASDEEDDYRNPYAITCAEYYHARARSLCAAGDVDGAKERVRWASELWPPIRQKMLDDPGLAGIW